MNPLSLAHGPPKPDRIVYRPPLRQAFIALVGLLIAIGFLWLSASPAISHLFSSPPPTKQSLKDKPPKKQENDSFEVWMCFAAGGFLLCLAPVVLWDAFMFRLVVDVDGIRWRPFLSWRSVRWSEVDDCYFDIRRAPVIEVGKQKIAFSQHAKNWSLLRDFVSERVDLPEGVEGWRVKQKDERKFIPPADDDGAPITARSNVGWLALLGLFFGLSFGYFIIRRPQDAAFFSFPLVLSVGVFVVCPLIVQLRCFVRCDESGITIGRMWKQTRIAYADIEDLFLMGDISDGTVLYTPSLLVQGKPVQLQPLVTNKDQVLSRIEHNALHSRSRRFDKSNFITISGVPLPLTLRYRDTYKSLLISVPICLCFVVGALAKAVFEFERIGGQNFEWSSIYALAVVVVPLYLLLLFATWRKVREMKRLRSRLGEQIVVRQDDLYATSPTALTTIMWNEVARLERTRSDGKSLFRIHSVSGGVIEFDASLPKVGHLLVLAQERSDLKWET